MQKNSKKEGCFVFVVAIISSILLFLFIRHMIFGNSVNVPNIGRNINILPVIIIFMLILVINVIIAIIGFGIARKNQWKPILWLNQRLYSKVQEKRTSGNKVVSIVNNFNNKYNPERLLKIEKQDIPFGTFLTEDGERFMTPEKIFFHPSWNVETILPLFYRAGTQVFLISVISSTVLMIHPNFLILSTFLSLTVFVQVLFFYWKKEWDRYSKLFFITTHRIGYVKGQFSWMGLLFGAGIDVFFEEYNLEFINSISTDPVRDDIKHKLLYESFLELFGYVEEYVGTVRITILGYKGNETGSLLLNNYSYAPFIKAQINEAKEIKSDIEGLKQVIASKSMNHLTGQPGQYIDPDSKQEQVQEWQDNFQKQERILVDIFSLVRKHLEELSEAEHNENSETDNSNKANSTDEDSEKPTGLDIFPGK